MSDKTRKAIAERIKRTAETKAPKKAAKPKTEPKSA